jgi:hypothetical protein
MPRENIRMRQPLRKAQPFGTSTRTMAKIRLPETLDGLVVRQHSLTRASFKWAIFHLTNWL